MKSGPASYFQEKQGRCQARGGVSRTYQYPTMHLRPAAQPSAVLTPYPGKQRALFEKNTATITLFKAN